MSDTPDCAVSLQKRTRGGRKMSGRFVRCEHDRLVSMDVLQDGSYRRRRECSHSPVRKKRQSRSRTPSSVTRAVTRRRSTSNSFQHPRTAKSKAMAKAKAAMAEFRAKKAAARKARAAGATARTDLAKAPSTPTKLVTQKAKHKARYETPKKKKATVAKTPIPPSKGGRFAKKLDFHTKHESNYFDDHEWKADLASEDESIVFDLGAGDQAMGGFRVPTLPARKKLSLMKDNAPSSGRTTPTNADAARNSKRRRRLADGTWSLRRDGEMFSDDDEYDSDIERDDYPKRMRRRVGRDKFGDVWKYPRKRRRKTPGKKKSALSASDENDFKEEELVASEPERLDDPDMVYFDGLSRHPCLPYGPTTRIAVPKELVYDETGDVPGRLDAMTDVQAKESWGLVFGQDYQPSDRIPDLSAIIGSKPGKREVAGTPTTRAVTVYSPLNLEEIYEKQHPPTGETAKSKASAATLARFRRFFGDDDEDDGDDEEAASASSWSPFGLFGSMASWVGSWVKSTPKAHTPVAGAA